MSEPARARRARQKRIFARLLAEKDAIADSLRELVNSPVVAGMGAAIRDHAKHQGKPCPYAAALRVLARIDESRP